jgi:2-methylcitrate dehydratase PrpD
MFEEPLSLQHANHFNALRFDQIPNDITAAAKLHILDSIGYLLAGTRLEPGKLAYDMAIAASGGRHAGSSLFGAAERVSYPDAVEAMSVAAHCGEMDDIHGGAGICIGGLIIPALPAMAEKFHRSGRQFIEAAVVGYETVIRVGLCIGAPKLFARGWWPSTVCGACGVS